MNKAVALYKNAYGGLSPATWWLSVVMLINRCGTMVVPFMTLYLTEERGVSIRAAGLVMALFGAGAICGGLIGGRLSDRFGFYPIQLITLSGGGIMFMILGQLQHFTAICICTFLLSLINEAFRPANATAIVQYSRPENRTRSYSLNRLAINLGWALGGALGGFIASRNYELLFWIDGFTNLSAAVLLRILLPPVARSAQSVKKVKRALLPADSPLRDRIYMVFTVLTMLYAYCFFQLFTTLPLFFRRELKLDESSIGVVMALNGLIIALFEMVLIFRLEASRHHMMRLITTGTLLTGLSFIIFNSGLPGLMMALLSMLICTVGEMLAMPFMNTFWISRTNDTNRGSYAGLYTVAWASAQVLGPGTGSLLAEEFGFTNLWWFIGFIALVTAAGFYWLQRRLTASVAAAE